MSDAVHSMASLCRIVGMSDQTGRNLSRRGLPSELAVEPGRGGHVRFSEDQAVRVAVYLALWLVLAPAVADAAFASWDGSEVVTYDHGPTRAAIDVSRVINSVRAPPVAIAA